MESGEEAGRSWPKVCKVSLRKYYQEILSIIREFQLFLLGYIIVSICEIFTVGGFPLNSNVRLVCAGSSIFPAGYAYKLYRGLQLCT